MRIRQINKNSCAFNGILSLQGLEDNPVRKNIAESIENKLFEACPSDRKNRTFVELAEKVNQDIYFSFSGHENKDAVRVDLLNKRYSRETCLFARIPFSDETKLGLYTEPEQFKIEDFTERLNLISDAKTKHSKRLLKKADTCLKVITGSVLAFLAIHFLKK